MKDLPSIFNDNLPATMTTDELKSRLTEDIALMGQELSCPPSDVVFCTQDGTALFGNETLGSLFPTVAPPTRGALPNRGDMCSASDGLSETATSIAEAGSTSDIAELEAPLEHVLFLTLSPTYPILCGMTTCQALAAAHKLHTGELLHFTDLRALNYAMFFEDRKNPVYPVHISNKNRATFYECVEHYVLDAYQGTNLSELWWQDFRDGDIIFYDLQGRESMGDYTPETLIATWAYYIQKKYDQHSHSGILMIPRSHDTHDYPCVFHGLATKIKAILHPVCAVTIVPRRLAFEKIFTGYDLLEESVQKSLPEYFAVALREAAAREYDNCGPQVHDALWKFIAPRREGLNQDLALVSPRRNPDEPNVGSPTPKNVPALCSGFTASIIFSCCQRVQDIVVERYPHLRACLQLQPHVRTDVVNFTPRDLHRWGVWGPPVPPMGFEKHLHPEVNASRRLYAY
jgi:hypothetical protein